MRARNYGIRVVLTHTSTLSGVRSAIRNESAQRLEMKLVDPLDSQIPRDPSDPQRSPAKEVPDVPGRGLSPTGHHLMVGVPVLANEAGGPVAVREIGAVVRRVAGVDKAATVTRLPESVALAEVSPLPGGRAARSWWRSGSPSRRCPRRSSTSPSIRM